MKEYIYIFKVITICYFDLKISYNPNQHAFIHVLETELSNLTLCVTFIKEWK